MIGKDECCATCKHRFKAYKWDYSHEGCEHTDMEGFICMAHGHEGAAIWMIGVENGFCECYESKRRIKDEADRR